MRRPHISWRVVITAAATLAFLVPLAVVGFLLSRPGRQWTLAWIERAAASQGIGFKASEVSYRLSAPGMVFEQIELRTPVGPFLSATRLEIHLKGTAVEFSLTAPKVTVIIDKGGSSNLPTLPKGLGGPSITVEKVHLIDGSLTVRDDSRSIGLQLDRWQALATRDSVVFSTNQPGLASYQGRTETIDSVRLSYSRGAIKKLELATSVGRLEAEGVVEPQLDLNVHADADLARVLDGVRGTASARMRVTGTSAKPLMSGELTAAGLHWRTIGPLNGTTQFALNEAMDRVRLSAAHANWGAASFSGNADVVRTGRSEATVQIAGLHTRQLEALLGHKIPVATHVGGNVSANWPGVDGFADAVGHASLRFSAWRGQVDFSADPITARVVTSGLETEAAVVRADVAVGRRSRELSGTIDIDVPDAGAAARFLRLEVPAMTGPFVLKTTLAGTLAQPAVDFELDSPGLVVAQNRETKLAVRGHATPRVVRIDLLEASAGSIRAVASGQADLGSDDTILHFDGTLDSTPLSAFTTLADGEVSGTFSIRGTALQPEASGKLSADNLRAYGEALGNARAEVRYGAAGLSFPRVELTKGNGAIIASANPSHQANAEIRNYAIDALKLPNGLTAGGILNGKASFEGLSPEVGTGELRLLVTNLSAAGRKPGDVELSAVLAQGIVKASASVPAWGITSTLQASVRAPYASTLEATMRDFAIQNVAAITGAVSGTIRASGEIATPDTLRVEADLTSLKVKIDSEEASNSGPLRVRYAAGVADIESATFVSGDSRLTMQGKVPVLQGQASLAFEGDLDVALVARLAKLDPALDPVGRLRARGTLAGAAPNWQPDVTGELSAGRVNVPGMSAPLTGIQASISAREGIIKLTEATASWLGGTVRLAGEVPFAANEYRLEAEGNGLRLEQIQGSSQLVGVVSLRAEAQGKGFGVRDVNAKLESPALRFQMGGMELAAQSTPTVTLRDGLVQIQDFELAGPGTRFRVRGGTALIEPYPLAVRIDGDLDAALVGLFTDALAAQGRTKVQVALTGTARNPRFGGSVELNGAQVTIPKADAVVENLNARADFLGQQITLSGVTGTLNGGTLTASGTAEMKNGALANVAVELRSRNSAWNIPEGLETATDIDLKLEGTPQQLTLAGDIQILEGSYRERLVIERGLFSVLQASATSTASNAGAPGQVPINLNVRVRTASPILVANDLLNGALNADLRLRGSPQRPGLTGRVDLEEGGNIFLGGRNYLVERAAATFTSERKIEPVLDVLAQTRAGGRQITLEARGTVGSKIETRFSSDDGLPEPDVLAILVTGRTLREARGAEVDIASDQALSYLTGSIGSTVSVQASRALGFKLVRIDPSLIAQEAEPTARLTLGQDLTDRVGLVYSVNLKNSTDQIWIGRVDLTPRFSTRVVRQTDNSYRFQFQHDLEFGGEEIRKRKRRDAESLRVGAVTITGNSPVSEAELKKRFGLRTGKSYDFLRFRKGVERIKESLANKGYPEAIVRTERKSASKGTVDLSLAINAGVPVQFVYEGATVPRGVRRRVERAWSGNSFDSLRSRQVKAVLLEHFAEGGYYEASVDPAVQDTPGGKKRVLLEVARGTRHRRIEFTFPGAAPENIAGLRELFRDKQARLEAVLRPERAREQVAAYYRGRGYLEANAKPRMLDRSAVGTLRFALPVSEGNRYRVGRVEVVGAAESTAPLASASFYAPAEADRAAERIVESLEGKGYTKAEATVEVSPNPEAKTVDLAYRVTPGDKQVLQAVDVQGNRLTSEGLVRSQVDLSPGQPITAEKLSQARRNLYDTGAFAFTDLELQPGDRGPNGISTRLLARVREVRPYELRYGGLYDTDNGLGGIIDFSARNVLGAARVVGIRGRYDGKLHEARAYFEQPNLLRFPMKWVTIGFVRREINEGFLTDRAGGSMTGEFRWRKHYRLNAGYRLEQVHTFDREPGAIPLDIRLRIAPLTVGFQRDTRNDILDSRSGSYSSHVAEWAPARLGSQFRYAKYFGQYFHYRPLLGERRFANAPSRPKLVFAGGARFGIAADLGGDELIPSERFFSGGGTSVRGFAQDTLGAAPGRSPVGGEGLWIANAEGRIPLHKYADVVGFLDVGNLYRRWDDLSLSGARFSAGLGVRIRTPYILFRIDYGIKLNRRPGESFGGLFGGLGQAV